MNENMKLVVELSNYCDFMIGSTVFFPKNIYKITMVSQDRIMESQISHHIVNTPVCKTWVVTFLLFSFVGNYMYTVYTFKYFFLHLALWKTKNRFGYIVT